MKETTVLIIDDEQSYLDTISQTLENKNYNILQALDGKMGCIVAEKFLPDVIIIDWEMPVMNGIEAIKYLKQQPKTKDIPIIMSTGIMTAVEHLETALQAGAVDFLRKPIDPVELIARLNSVMNLARAYKKILNQAKNLEKLNATKDKFFSIIAHDLRGPIGGIVTALEILKNRTANTKRDERILSSLHQASKQTYKLLKNLLTWARLQRGDIEFNPEISDVKIVVESVLKLLKSTLLEKSISTSLYINENSTAYFDNEMIHSILRNIIGNAIKYTPVNGHIHIESQKSDDYLIITITDSGEGLSPDELESLFQTDYKRNSKVGTNGEIGTGLGLVLCKEFTDRHFGEISAKNHPNGGASFSIQLPLNEKIYTKNKQKNLES